MTMISSALNFADMAKKANIEQVNVRLPVELAKRIRRFCERHPFKPSMTRFAEIAFTDYLEQNEPQLPDQHHKGAK